MRRPKAARMEELFGGGVVQSKGPESPQQAAGPWRWGLQAAGAAAAPGQAEGPGGRQKAPHRLPGKESPESG